MFGSNEGLCVFLCVYLSCIGVFLARIYFVCLKGRLINTFLLNTQNMRFDGKHIADVHLFINTCTMCRVLRWASRPGEVFLLST